MISVYRLYLKAIIASFLLTLFFLLTPFLNYFKATFNFRSPQLILVLGGDIDREHVGIRLAKELKLPLILSGGSNPEHASWLISESGIQPELATLDYRAEDTLTNFTSLVDDLKHKGVNNILLITSEDHLQRAMAVGWIVAGSRGIHLSAFAVVCEPLCERESWQKKFFDITRSFFWVSTGKDLKVLAKLRWPRLLGDF